jgi:hypothetical protein
MTSHASAEQKHVMDVNRVKDLEDFDDHNLSSDDDDGLAIHAKPLDSPPPPRTGKKILPNFGVDAS